MLKKLSTIKDFAVVLAKEPRRIVRQTLAGKAGASFASRYPQAEPDPGMTERPGRTSAFEQYFDANLEGPGIWKWRHYFQVYERYFAKFRGREVNVCEIGVYSGGSLAMWRNYLGPNCRVFGVDIQDACKVYEDARTRILIGDQGDRDFWRVARESLPPLDIVIDDGGHQAHQQIVTLEELLPYMKMGGVYLCEDLHGQGNAFASYAHSLSDALNAAHCPDIPPQKEGDGCCICTPFQQQIQSIHFYPFLTVIEKADSAVERLLSAKHGTEWQPF